MTTQFGWLDTLHALSTCLSCTAASSSTDSLHDHTPNTRATRQSTTSNGSGSRARAQTSTQLLTDGLRPLLQEDSTDDEYADTLSLHSNVGDAGSRGEGEGSRRVRRVKSKRRGKKIRQDDGWFTIFGYSLFGKRTGAIQLPLTDDEDEEEPNRGDGRIVNRTRSGSTLDSDAAQLDDAAIAELSRAHIAGQVQTAHTERVQQADKEQRRRKRKERKQREALERALAAGLSLDSNGASGFEGYQGSGDDVMIPRPGNSVSSRSIGTSITLTAGDADDEELADFDGSAYVQAAVNATGAAGNNSGSRTTTSKSSSASGSRSRRSHSRTHETGDPFHDDMPSPALEPSFTVNPSNSVNDQVKQKKAKTHRTKPTPPPSSSVAASDSGRTTSTRSATDSLPSPTGSTSLGPGLSLSLSSSNDQAQVSPQPHLTRNDGKTKKSTRSLDNGPFYDRGPNRGFPSVGFGRVRGDSLVNGAFLARRGDE